MDYQSDAGESSSSASHLWVKVGLVGGVTEAGPLDYSTIRANAPQSKLHLGVAGMEARSSRQQTRCPGQDGGQQRGNPTAPA